MGEQPRRGSATDDAVPPAADDTPPGAAPARGTAAEAASTAAGGSSGSDSPRAPAGASGGRQAKDARAPYGWWPAIVIICVTLVDRLESSVLPAILVDLQAEWGFSDTAGGSLSAAISIMGTAMALPAGYLADRANRKNLLAIVVALWSVITLGSAVAISFAMFYATRLALAAADSIDNPSQVSLLADYYSVEVRPKVLGFHRMMWFSGMALGMIYGGVVAQFFGWRAVFYAIIVPGLVVALWCYRLHEPRRGEADARAAAAAGRAQAETARHDAEGPRVAEGPADADPGGVARVAAAEDGVAGEAAAEGVNPNGEHPDDAAFDMVNLTQEAGVRALFAQVGTVVRIRTVVLVYSGLAALFFGLNGIFFWLPTFYRREFEVGAGLAGILTASIVLVGTIGGTWIGGVLGERWHGTVVGGRVVAGAGGILAGTLVFPGGLLAQSLLWQVLSLMVAVILMSIAIPNLQSAIADSLPANQRGVGFGLLAIFTTFGAFGPLLVGAISDATDSLRIAFGILLLPMLVGGAVTMLGRNTYEGDAARALEAVVDAARGAGGTDRSDADGGDEDA